MRTTNTKTLRWLAADARDDFFPDLLRFRDLSTITEIACTVRKEDTVVALEVPKNSLFQRQAYWIPPALRLQYLDTVRELMHPLLPTISRGCYSYRPKAANEDVPFPQAAQDWLRFRSDFRDSISQGGKWAVQTDISSYFDHLRADRVIDSTKRALPNSLQDHYKGTLSQLYRILEHIVGPSGSLPPNNDASSFLGSAFLAEVDTQVSIRRGIQYFRYQDDIKIVGTTRDSVVDAFLVLQRLLRAHGLFLNTEKTKLLEPGTSEWAREVDGEFDKHLNNIDNAIEIGAISELSPTTLLEEFRKYFSDGEDLRRGRAIGIRLLRLRSELVTHDKLDDELRKIALRGLLTHPAQSEFWYRIISRVPSAATANELSRVARLTSHHWLRFWHLAMLTAHDRVPATALGLARDTVDKFPGSFPFTIALVLLAKHGLRKDRELVTSHARTLYPTQIGRGVAIACGFLEHARERSLGFRALRHRGPFIDSVIRYLKDGNTPPGLWLDNYPEPQLLTSIGTRYVRLRGELRRIESARGSADYD